MGGDGAHSSSIKYGKEHSDSKNAHFDAMKVRTDAHTPHTPMYSKTTKLILLYTVVKFPKYSLN